MEKFQNALSGFMREFEKIRNNPNAGEVRAWLRSRFAEELSRGSAATRLSAEDLAIFGGRNLPTSLPPESLPFLLSGAAGDEVQLTEILEPPTR